MWAENNWREYELIDASDGERLERWGKYLLIRPDPQIIWKGMKKSPLWNKADAVYSRSHSGGGSWSENRLPDDWEISYRIGSEKELRFMIRPTGFKHTGLFPEQAVNWERLYRLIRNSGREVNVLNLFAYTGGATAACAAAGAKVCHVDASKGMVGQARLNLKLSGLENAPVRYIVDDCKKFCEREIRRGTRYDIVIMDPPSYGRGPGGEVWKLEENISELVRTVSAVLSEKPLMFVLNSYTTGLSAGTMGYLLAGTVGKKLGGTTFSDEIGLKVSSTGGVLPCGSTAIWQSETADV